MKSKSAFREWHDAGRPTDGHLLESKKKAHSEFKRAVKYIKTHENELKATSLAENLFSS